MARGRGSAPLLEVIDPSRPLTRQARRGIFSTIAGWFRSARRAGQPAPVYRTVSDAQGSTAAPAAAAQAAAAPAAAAPPRPEQTAAPTTAEPGPARAVLTPDAGAGAVAEGPIRRVALDSRHGELVIRLTYTSAVVWVMLLLTSMAAAFLAGQHRASGPRPAVAPQSLDNLRSQPAQGQVANLMAVRRTSGQQPPAAEAVEAPAAGSSGAAPGAAATGAAQPQVVRDRNRTVGLNYVVIQSYPDEKMATEAMKTLVQNGIECTVEKGPPGWASASWYSVVGVDGFVRITNSPQYDAYIKRIREISDKFARRGSFKAFDPKPYKWGRSP